MKHHILVVDDEPAVRSTFVDLLNFSGYRVDEAENGRKALSLILKTQWGNEPFDLVITDFQMPEMSGVELIQEIRIYGISIPVVVVSGLWSVGLMDRFGADGLIECIMKPFDPKKLVGRIEYLLEESDREKHKSKHLRSPLAI